LLLNPEHREGSIELIGLIFLGTLCAFKCSENVELIDELSPEVRISILS
jgi:hypothetical protein